MCDSELNKRGLSPEELEEIYERARDNAGRPVCASKDFETGKVKYQTPPAEETTTTSES
jgi:hypothetical protein